MFNEKNSSGQHELGLQEVIEKYPNVSPFAIIKTDMQRRTVQYTKRALDAVDISLHQVQYRGFSMEKNDSIPVSLLLRDGSTVLTSPMKTVRKPYTIDQIDGRLVVTDEDAIIEEVEYWPKPDYYDKFTSSGKPMWQIASARPQRIDINPYSYCHFWDNGSGCKYCNIAANYNQNKKEKALQLNAEDVFETVGEALKQPGKLTNIFLTGGSIPGGEGTFDQEVDIYVDILQAIGRNFRTKKFPSQLIATAFTEKQLARIYENTGLMTYTADIEVLNEEKFNWICPGKKEWIGYQEWKKRLIDAVAIFGRGNVNTGLVGGVELAKPYGFTNEDEALDVTLEEAEDLASHGVSAVFCVWNPTPGSIFGGQANPSLEYYVRLAQGLHKLRKKYGLNIDMDNYRRCGNHPDTDLSRI